MSIIPLSIFWVFLPLEVVFILRICKIWCGHLSLSLEFDHGPISGCWDILLLTFWGRLPLEVVLILRIWKIWFIHLSLSLKFEHDLIRWVGNYTENNATSWPILQDRSSVAILGLVSFQINIKREIDIEIGIIISVEPYTPTGLHICHQP